MSSPVVAPRAVPVSGRTVALFGGAVVTLAVAFVVAPRLLAGTSTGTGYADRGALAVAFGEAFTGYWRSGAPELPPRLEQVVEYWFRYHVVKAVVAAALLAVLAVLAVRLWRACARGTAPGNGRAGRITSGAGAVAATVLAAASALLVMANIQGAVAPFASLLPLLNGSRDPELAGALGQVREQLADPPAAGCVPALGVMVDDFSRYHLAMAVIAAAWRCCWPSSPRWRGAGSPPPARTTGAGGVAGGLRVAGLLLGTARLRGGRGQHGHRLGRRPGTARAVRGRLVTPGGHGGPDGPRSAREHLREEIVQAPRQPGDLLLQRQ
ncbi:hypothetical protein ACFQ1I_02755 [Kitasatospora arboriphila]